MRERESLIQFMESAFRTVIAYPPEEWSGISTGPVRWDVDEVLHFQAITQRDISTLLEIWNSAKGLETQLHLALFARGVASNFEVSRPFGISLADANSLVLEQLTTWLLNPSLVATLMDTFEEGLEGPWANMLAAGIDGLEFIQQVGVDSLARGFFNYPR